MLLSTMEPEEPAVKEEMYIFVYKCMLIDRWMDRLIDWSVDWSVGQSVSWLVGQAVRQSGGRPANW